MFESLLADILNRYLKPYVKKLDTSQLRLGIWKGDVCLENLELKDHIFTDLGVPVTIKSSHIGKIILKIPWKNLTKESIIVTIEDVFVIAVPVADSVYDEKKEKGRKWEKKQSKLKDIEEARKKQESQKEEKDTFLEKLITHIVKNLLVKVKSIHIRYEDAVTNPGHPMAVGVTLDSIEMQTTDSAYKPCVIKENATEIFKLIQMNCLALYWMVDTSPLADLPVDTMKEKMKALIACKSQSCKRVSYILQPVSAEAKMRLNVKPKYKDSHSNDTKVTVDITNDAMEIVFSRTQYCSLLDTMESIDQGFVQQRYHKHRHKLRSGDKISRARAQWQYAIACVLEEQVKRKFLMWSWEYMKETRRVSKLYTAKYLDKITSFSTSSSLVKELEAMEQEMDLFNILLSRQQAINQKKRKEIRKMARKTVKDEAKADAKAEKLQQQQQKQQQLQQKQSETQQQIPPSTEMEKKKTGGFFSRLKNRLKHGDQPSSEEVKGSVNASQPDREAAAVPLTSASKEVKKSAKEIKEDLIAAEQTTIERQKLFEAIGYSEDSTKEVYPPEYIAERIKIKLNLLTVTLVDDTKGSKIGHLETRSITVSVVHRPADNGVTVHSSVGGITLLGVAHESHDTIIISTPETLEETGDPSPLVVMQFDVNPLGMSTDFKIFASLNPMEIIYDAETIDSVISMFLVQKIIHFQELTAATMATVEELRTQTRAGLDYVMKKRKLMDVELSLKSPYIVVPSGGVYDSSSSVVVVDFGDLEISSNSKEFVGTNKAKEVEDYYDTFNINLSAVQVLVAKPGEDWRHARAATNVTTSPLHILQPAGMKLVIQKSILQRDAFLPGLKVEGAFSSFEVLISDVRLKELMKVLLSIQIPPPSLKNATKFIETSSDTVSVMVMEKLERIAKPIEQDSVLSISPDEPRPTGEVDSPPQLSSVEVSQSAATVFTQLSLNLSIKQISLKLNHEQEDESPMRPLLHLQISGVIADVRDRSWDTSAAVSVDDIVIFDHITKDSNGVPVKLLEADNLTSAKVLSLKAVLLSKTRTELAAKLTSGESTINCNMSLLQLRVHENTMVELSHVVFLLAPLLLEIPNSQSTNYPLVHSTPVDAPVTKTASSSAIAKLKMSAEAYFSGLKVTVSDKDGPFISTEILDLQVTGLFSRDKKGMTASMDGLTVTDLCEVSGYSKVISVSGEDKKMVEFKASLTSIPVSDDGSDQSELAVDLEVQQLKIYLIMQLLSRFMKMISHLHFDPNFVNVVQERSRGTRDNEVVVPKLPPVGRTAAKVLAKLNLHLHAPVVIMPIIGSLSALRFDLGEFVLTTADSQVITQLNGSKFVRETIRITSDGIRAERVSIKGDGSCCEMLPVVKFDVNIVRNLIENPVDMPLIDVQFKLQSVKVHLCNKEVVAFLLLISSFDELTKVGKDISHSVVGSGRRKVNNIVPVAVDKLSADDVISTSRIVMASIKADLTSLQLEVAPLCKAEIKVLSTTCLVDNIKTEIHTSFNTITIFDLASENEKITSYLDKQKPFADLKVVVYQQAHREIYSKDIPLPINTQFDVNLSSFHLILNMGFISRSIEFGRSIVVHPDVLQKLACVVQDAANALPEQLARFNVFVSAPVIYLSLPKAHSQALILNCGQLKMNNIYLKLEDKTETDVVAFINRYSFSLTQLTISRAILSFYEESVDIKAQRVLLEPIQFTADFSVSLSPDVSSVPITSIDANLGRVKVSYGDEDVKSVVNFVTNIIGSLKSMDASERAADQGLVVQETRVGVISKELPVEHTVSTTGTADSLAFSVILESFCVNTFMNEPHLSPKTSKIASSDALLTVSVTDLLVEGGIATNGDKTVETNLGSFEIIDAREKSKEKVTTKLLQSFKADPTRELMEKASDSLITVTLKSLHESTNDYVTIKVQPMLVLLDVEFISTIQSYSVSIYENVLNPDTNEPVRDAIQSLKSMGDKCGQVKFQLAEADEKSVMKRGFKLQGEAVNLTVAILDPEQLIEQAVLLQTTIFTNIMKDTSRELTQLSLHLNNLCVTSCHLLALDSPISFLLLPATINVTFNMVPTKLELWANVDCITINISPAIISLLVDVVNALVPKKMESVEETDVISADIWNKHELSPSKWYLMPVLSRRYKGAVDSSVDVPNRNEVVNIDVSRFEVNISRGHGPVSAELALNGNMCLEVKDISGALQAHATMQLEASYYNDHHSLWEPLIEPLEDITGKSVLWTGKVEVKRSLSDDCVDAMRASVTSLSSLNSLTDSSARYNATISASQPLQVTLSKKSLTLIKDTVEVYTTNVSRDAISHKKPPNEFTTSSAAFTIKNKLGQGIVVLVKPGETLKFIKEDKEFVKISYGQFADLRYARDEFSARKSKSILLKQPKKKKEVKYHVDVKIASFDVLREVSIATPGLFYHTLSRKNPKTNATDKASVVIEIIFSDTAKTIFIRSPLQVQNHTDLPIELVIPSVEKPYLVPANGYFPIPLDKLDKPISFKPAGRCLDTDMMLHWMSDEALSVVKCTSHESTQPHHHLKVLKETELYDNSDVKISSDRPHHVFHIYPPAVLVNLLPVSVTVFNEVVGEGKDVTLFQLDPLQVESLKITLNDVSQDSCGVVPVFDEMDEYTRLKIGDTMELSVHRENLGYHKLSLFAPYWMINKTELNLEYRDFESKKKTFHHSGQEIMCYSCDPSNKTSRIQFSAKLWDSRHTEWSAVTSLSAAGSRGCARLKCGNVIHDLGIRIQLSKFTLTKIVTITPYYLIINETKHYIKCVLGDDSTVEVQSKNVRAVWPRTNDPSMHIIIEGVKSKTFMYRNAASDDKNKIVENVLLKMRSDVVAIVVEFNITQHAHVITFSPYYAGAMPAMIVNACDSCAIRIRQNTMSTKEQFELQPHESIMYTWGDPAATRSLWWSVVGNNEQCSKPIILAKNDSGSFKFPVGLKTTTSVEETSWMIATEETEDGFTEVLSESSMVVSTTSTSTGDMVAAYWVSFLDHLQRVVLFTQDRDVVELAKAGEETGLPILDFTLSLKSIGVSLVNNAKKKEIAYIGITQSSVIWEVKKKRNKWITLNNEIISLLEEEYKKNPKVASINKGKLIADLSIMQISSPYKGQLRRTYYDGLSVHFKLNEKQIELGAKIGHIQVDNQLPFSVYPQVLYPLPPPPTVASTCEPKPFIEGSVIIRRSEKLSMAHIQYAGLLIQEMSLNVDLGFLLSIISFFTLRNSQSRLGEYVASQKKEALLPLRDFSSSGKAITDHRYFFTLIHFSPIKIRLSFNIRSYGKNLDPEEDTVAKQALNLLLHSLGVVLTSVQETEMKFAYLHLEYQQATLDRLKDMMMKHYTAQTLYQIYSLIFGLDMLGNPVSLVRGVAGGAIDLFYEPYKGVVLGGDEFLQGLGIGLMSFLGGTVGGIAGAGAKVTGAVGDVFAKLTFDEEFIDRRQQQKTAPPKLGSKFGGFAKNLFQGVTGVVTQPVKGVKEEGVFGLAKGMGKGVVGLVLRPTGGLIDLASGGLDTVRRGTSLNNVEVIQMRPPRFIDKEGILTPYSSKKAFGSALLLILEDGAYASTDYYTDHLEIAPDPMHILLITDMRVIAVQRSRLFQGWSITWEVVHSKVKGIQLNGVTLEAIYKSKRSGFDKLQQLYPKYNERYQLPNVGVAREAIDLITKAVDYNL